MLFGYVCLLAGLIILGLGIYIYVTGNEEMIRQGLLIVVTVVGASILLLTFLFELFIESLVTSKNRTENNID